MQDYKIRIPNADISRQVQEKAFELGYTWFRDVVAPFNFPIIYLYLINGRLNHGTTENFFIQQHYPEISYQDFLRLGEPTINNTTTEEIMSGEITLKCITAPQKAKKYHRRSRLYWNPH